jgi:hypothetical protein
MNYYHLFFKYCLIFWPLIITIQAYFYRKKQSGSNPFTGGQISIPKAFWLSYTVWTWFLLPIIFVFHPLLSSGNKIILYCHLASWWIRGILELVMIYKWFNWSPRYGISHDVFHLSMISVLLYLFRYEVLFSVTGPINFFALYYILMLFVSTSSEILFAKLFLEYRSENEVKDNIYFASDEEKWKKINRITLTVVVIVFIHLIFQSIFSFFYL